MDIIYSPTLVQNKVKLLFEKISEPQYVMNNYYVDHFFIKINSNDPGKCILYKLSSSFSTNYGYICTYFILGLLFLNKTN